MKRVKLLSSKVLEDVLVRISIEGGEDEDASVKVEMAEDIGQKVIDSMIGKLILRISF